MGWNVLIMADVAFVADGLATWDLLLYFKFSDVKQNLISYVRWYLPMVLFRDGLCFMHFLCFSLFSLILKKMPNIFA